MTCLLCSKYDQKPGGVLPEKLGGGETPPLFQTKICAFSYPILDLKNWSPARDKLLWYVRATATWSGPSFFNCIDRARS